MSNNENLLTANRKHLTARQSIQSIISYARDQDEKMFTFAKKRAYSRVLLTFIFVAPPFFYTLSQMFSGYWRNIYPPGSIFASPVENIQGKFREQFLPEMFLKEREKRKIQLGLKQAGELQEAFKKE